MGSRVEMWEYVAKKTFLSIAFEIFINFIVVKMFYEKKVQRKFVTTGTMLFGIILSQFPRGSEIVLYIWKHNFIYANTSKLSIYLCTLTSIRAFFEKDQLFLPLVCLNLAYLIRYTLSLIHI
eukprot:TRINITY_DN6217_c0_g1_i2.p3 TRINITY_DN6217_c0_g1~~TRINITY_DN6217_c0_g1_i2.p3  ORF type:complete len:122 (-),score=23.08 TRINITY_DN6217_c0_g1_i2:60-425(-)